MSVRIAVRAALLLIVLSLFACGEIETLLPTSGTYQVRTLVNGSYLEDCSIIRSNDKIRPYFAVSVVNDPDLIGLSVYLQNSQGEIVGEKVRYILDIYADETALTEADLNETETWEETETDNIGDEALNEELDEMSDEDETQGRAIGDFSEQNTVSQQWGFTNTRIEKDSNDVEIAVKSLEEDLPYFPLPQDLEIGPYTLVFEAFGQKEILSRTETDIFYLGSAEFNLRDIAVYLSGLSISQLVSPGSTIMLEARLDFDSRLDPYVIWYNGKNIINRGKLSEGLGSILWTAPGQAGFYSLRLEAFPFQLTRNFAGVSREIALPVSPKAVSLGYFFEDDPNFTARNFLAAGTAYPQQLQLIAAMPPEEDPDSEELIAPVPPSPPELLRWYQFEGNLSDSTAALTDEQSLLPLSEKGPHWAAAGQTYGLSSDSDNAYQLLPLNFFREEEDQGGGIFLLHIKPSVEGVIFSTFFPSQFSTNNGIWMDMIRERNIIALRLSDGGTSVEIPVYFNYLGSQDLVPIAVEFYIRPYRLEARISLGEEYFLQSTTGGIMLSGALSGEGRIRLGGNGGGDKSTLDISTLDISTLIQASAASISDSTEFQSEEIPEEILFEEILLEETTDVPAIDEDSPKNTVWDEFAILFSSVPLMQEIIIIEAAIIDEPETETETSEIYTPVLQEEEIPALDSSVESGFAETDEIKIQEIIEDEDLVFPAADTDTDNYTQEWETFAVLPENH